LQQGQRLLSCAAVEAIDLVDGRRGDVEFERVDEAGVLEAYLNITHNYIGITNFTLQPRKGIKYKRNTLSLFEIFSLSIIR
jgi:hypothetical protein